MKKQNVVLTVKKDMNIKKVQLETVCKAVVGLGWSVVEKEGKKVRRNKDDLIDLLIANNVEAIEFSISGELVRVLHKEQTGKIKTLVRHVAYGLNKGNNVKVVGDKEKVVLSTLDQAISAMSLINKGFSSAVLNRIEQGVTLREALDTVKAAYSEFALYVSAFKAYFFIPKNFVVPTRPQYVTLKATINRISFGDKPVSELSYDLADLNELGSGFITQSEKDSIDQLGYETVIIKKKQTITEKGRTRTITASVPVRLVKRLLIVKVGAYVRSEEEEFDTARLIDRLYEEGLYVVGASFDSAELHYVPFKRSTSQARQLYHTFLLNDSNFAVAEALLSAGTDPMMYTKDADPFNKDLRKLKLADPDKRKALDGSDTIGCSVLNFGTKHMRVKPGTNEPAEPGAKRYDIVVYGGPVSLRVVDNPYSIVSKGKIRVLEIDKNDPTKTVSKVIDIAEDPDKYSQVLMMLDGACAYNDYVRYLLSTTYGRNVTSLQFRAARTVFKGLHFCMPDLHEYYPEDVIMFGGSTKGNIEEYLDAGNDINFRIARINPSSHSNKEYTILPYQGVHSTRLTSVDLSRIVQKHLDGIKDMLEKPELLQKYLGVENIEDVVSNLDASEVEDYLDSKLTTTLTRALHFSKNKAYADTYLKQKAFGIIEVLLRKWFTGQVPVEGSYKYLVQDPKAVFDALRRSYERGDNIVEHEGQEIVIVPTDMGLYADTVVVTVADYKRKDGKGEVIFEGKCVLHRNPNLSVGQLAPVTSVNDKWYAEKVAQGYFGNLIIVSCHDFALVRQGGADVDGDTSLVIFEKLVVDHVFKLGLKDAATLDRGYIKNEDGTLEWVDGSPYKTPKVKDDNYYRLSIGSGKGQVLKQNEFEVVFHREQYGPELVSELMKLELDWVKRTLKENHIGSMTNVATFLADAIRRMSNAIMLNKTIFGKDLPANETEAMKLGCSQDFLKHNKEQYITWIAEFTNKIDWMYRGQSWEIDRPKHGGAYEEYLQSQFAFFFDNTEYPEIASYKTDKIAKNGKPIRKFIKPIWLYAFKNCKTLEEMFVAFNTKFTGNKQNHVHSTLTQHFINMMKWYSEFRVTFFKDNGSMFDHNLIPLLNTVACDNDTFKKLAEPLREIKSAYNTGNQVIGQQYQAKLAELKASLSGTMISLGEYLDYSRALDETVKEKRKLLVADCIQMLAQNDVLDSADPVHVGYVSYMITYDQKAKADKFSTFMTKQLEGDTTATKRPLSFAWTITEAQLMKALEASVSPISHVEEAVIPFTDKYLNFSVPTTFDINDIAARITKHIDKPLVVMLRQNAEGISKYYAHIYKEETQKYEAVGVVYSSYAQYFKAGTYFELPLNKAVKVSKQNIVIHPSAVVRKA